MTDKNTIENSLQDFAKIESSKFVVLGNVDSSKSSTIGVLTKNILDDGNGYARSLITKLKHEQETGRTSSHSFHYIINKNEITTLVDLCGHERYLKTTMFGVMGLFGDYGMIMIGANMGLAGMTAEHMQILMANKLPFLTIVSKIDICPPNILHQVKRELDRVAKRYKKEIIYFEDEETEINGSYLKDSHKLIIERLQQRDTSLMPVIMTSNKTGHNINFLKELICNIRSQAYLERKGVIVKQAEEKTKDYPMIMYIDGTYAIPGIGIVLSGTVKYGSISLGQKLYLGPINNNYITIIVKSIHNCVSENVNILHENESGSIGIRLESKGSYSRDMFNKGQVITDNYDFAMKNTCYSFKCTVAIFNHPTTIKNGYQSMIHLRTVRQPVKFFIENDKVLRTGSKEDLTLKFLQRPEFILPDTLFMFRDGRVKGLGKTFQISKPFFEDTAEPVMRKKKGNRKRADRKVSKKDDNNTSNTKTHKPNFIKKKDSELQ